MSYLNHQTMTLLLSLLGIVVLIACLLMIILNRVPELKSPQVIKGFGVDLNVSVITLLVLVGLALTLTSTYLQVKNYDDKLDAATEQLKSYELALARAGKMNVTAKIKLKGISEASEMPILQEVKCRYYIRNEGGGRWVEGAKVNPGLDGLDMFVTFEDITPMSYIERLEIKEENPTKPVLRKWIKVDVGDLLRPELELTKVDRP